jgi:hypothetical protein
MNEHAEYLPFHAINEFMRPDFRLSLLRDTLTALPDLSEEHNSRINRLTKKLVKITGFRNSEKAPALMKVIPMSKTFEKSPELVAAILAAWSDLNSQLRLEVYEMLIQRGWKYISTDQPLSLDVLSPELLRQWPMLPPQVDRTKLPGFYTRWPKGEDYETLYKHFTETYSNEEVSIDKVSLMVVWLALRLPFEMEEVEDVNPSNASQTQEAT